MGSVKLQRVETEDIRPDYESYYWWSGFWWAQGLTWGFLLGCYFDILPALGRAVWALVFGEGRGY